MIDNKKIKSKGHRIGLYIRVSTEEQAQNLEGSIKNQEQRLRHQVEIKNMDSHFGDIIDVYIDRAKSGKDTNRPELQRMLKDIRSNEINFVMASELSRISRSIKDFSEIWEMMQSHGCGFLSLRESFDSSSAAGEMVLFTVANIAQFERRQVSERVKLNLNARSKRGLYNGGSVPFGYELTPDKPGYLRIHKEHSEVIKKCFEAFLKMETLSRTAKWLNERGYRMQKYMQGGGRHKRKIHFTVDNLHHILQNKMYNGIKTYNENDEVKETKAVWEPIIDDLSFERVQKLLKSNKSRKKPHSKQRYPYLLSGITFCGKCGNHLSGKSAWGYSGKVPYYEHSWATKRGCTHSQRTFDCGSQRRFSGKKLEALLIGKVSDLLRDERLAKKLFAKVQQVHKSDKGQKELERIKASIYGFNSQIEALTERLSQLPTTVSAAPIFKQMEKLEGLKVESEEKLQQLRVNQRHIFRKPTELEDYLKFNSKLKEVFETGNAQVKEKIIKRLIHRIDVFTDKVKIHFIVDQDHFSWGPAKGSHLFLCPKSEKRQKKAPKSSDLEVLEAIPGFFKFFSSNSLTIGAPERT